jgi:hypothetical protein
MCRMIFSRRKADELKSVYRLRAGVRRVAKEALAREMLGFFIACYILMIVVLGAIVILSRLLGFEACGNALSFFVSNCVFLCFLMVFSFAYDVYSRSKWWVAFLAVGAFFSLTWLLRWVSEHRIRVTLALTSCALAAGILFLTTTGRRWRDLLARIRHKNEAKTKIRVRSESEIREFLRNAGARTSWPLRWLALRSAAHVAYSLTAFPDPKAALAEFVKRRRFRQEMAQLGAAIFAASGLCYIVLPLPEMPEMTLFVAKVLSVYGVAILLADWFDDARDEFFSDILELMPSGAD